MIFEINRIKFNLFMNSLIESPSINFSSFKYWNHRMNCKHFRNGIHDLGTPTKLSFKLPWSHISRNVVYTDNVRIFSNQNYTTTPLLINNKKSINKKKINIYLESLDELKENQEKMQTQTVLGQHNSQKSIIFYNGIFKDSTINSQEFLKQNPRGPYTTCRTIQHKMYIFMFDQHIERLCQSFKIMFAKDLDQKKLYREIKSNIESSIHYFVERKLDLKITILISENEEIYIHIVEYDSQTIKRDYVNADIAFGVRKEMLAKDSIWVQQMRDKLLEYKHKDSEEVIMCEEDGTLREGVSSNVFSIIKTSDNSFEVNTSNEGIIKGTVRDLVIKVIKNETVFNENCEKINIKLNFQDINIEKIDKYKEIFITSTSRLVMPIAKLYFTPQVSELYNLNSFYYFNKNCTYENTISHWIHVAITKEMVQSSIPLFENSNLNKNE